MKKKNIIIAIVLLLTFSSCEKFLEEDLISVATTQSIFRTRVGLQSLIDACYVDLRLWYGQEFGYVFGDGATDMWTYANQQSFPEMYTYSSVYNSNNGHIALLWAEWYKSLKACNDAIEYLNKEDCPFNSDEKRQRLGETHFLRAHYLWQIVLNFGGVQLYTVTPKEVVTTSQRSSEAEFYAQIFSDLDFAVNNLHVVENYIENEKGLPYGRVTKAAAIAMRARINVAMASMNSSKDYYQKAYNDAKMLLDSFPSFSLYDKYSDVWLMANAIGNSKGSNKECIWAVNYSYSNYSGLNIPESDIKDVYPSGQKEWGERDGGHHGHLMWGMQYDQLPGMERDLQNGRPFRRYFPVQHTLDMFNEKLDERYFGTFKVTWYCNNEATAPKYPTKGYFIARNNDTVRFDSALINTRIYSLGDTSIYCTKDDIPDSMMLKIPPAYYIHRTGKYLCYDRSMLYKSDGFPLGSVGTGTRNMSPQLSKYDDPRAFQTNIGYQRGQRDDFVFRLPEMYLIMAEALKFGATGTGTYTDAYDVLKILADKRAVEGKTGTELLASYGINSSADITIDYLLDERGREFAGELLRWYDLKRFPGKLIERTKKYNVDAQAIQEYHLLRPIPQNQLDLIENKTQFTQNPGY